MAEITAAVTADPIDVARHIGAVADPSCGGVAIFVGTVRNSAAVESNAGKGVVGLEYETHPTLSEERLGEVAAEATAKWDLAKVACVHRTGACALGEPTVVVACSSPHRADALEACRFMIDTIKRTVPIWKKEIYADGSAWVGAGS